MMAPWSKAQLRAEDSGNAIIEFLFLAILLMLPLVYVLLTAFRVQGAAFAASSAVREAGRVFVGTAPGEDPRLRAQAAAELVMADSGLVLRDEQLSIRCSADPCLTPGATVDVVIDYVVPLPFLPSLFVDRAPASVPVSSRHLELVDRFTARR